MILLLLCSGGDLVQDQIVGHAGLDLVVCKPTVAG